MLLSGSGVACNGLLMARWRAREKWLELSTDLWELGDGHGRVPRLERWTGGRRVLDIKDEWREAWDGIWQKLMSRMGGGDDVVYGALGAF